MSLQFFNTRTKTIEPLATLTEGRVTLYTCGPTVYDRLHVGNWAAYIYWDTLVRVLRGYGYQVERVMNITDVGHLVSDEDTGEDKLEKGARRENKTAWDVAQFYGDDFLRGMKRLHLLQPEHVTKATDFIDQQLALVRTLHDKGYTYLTSDGIYFDTAKFPAYANFAGLDLAAQRAGARVEFNDEKRNPSDFALWKFSQSGEKRDMEWETPALLLNGSAGGDAQGSVTLETSAARVSPGAVAPAETRSEAVSEVAEPEAPPALQRMGFPGWHLECSAMAMSVFGPTLDIHTGGIDHIPVHHTNEIAQSEAATGQRFANTWLHNNHLKVNGTKISKSLGNGFTLDDLEARGYSPLDYKLFVLQSHYQSEGNFTFEHVESAARRLVHWKNVAALRHQIHDTLAADREKTADNTSVTLFASSRALLETLGNNLDMPGGLTLIDEAFSRVETAPLDSVHQQSLVQFLQTIDELLGLELLPTTPDVDEAVKRLIIERERARDDKDWARSDELRDEIATHGIAVRDTKSGTVWSYA